MSEFYVWLENTPVAIWVRESGTLWSYPTILFLHTLGLGLVVGMSTGVSLRVLGVARRLPLAPLEQFYGILWLGFYVNAASGVLLLIADATTKFTNPVFYVKMVCVALAMVTMVALRRVVFRDPGIETGRVSAMGKGLAAIALVLWAVAIVAGRMMAYLGPVSGAPELMNTFP